MLCNVHMWISVARHKVCIEVTLEGTCAQAALLGIAAPGADGDGVDEPRRGTADHLQGTVARAAQIDAYAAWISRTMPYTEATETSSVAASSSMPCSLTREEVGKVPVGTIALSLGSKFRSKSDRDHESHSRRE